MINRTLVRTHVVRTLFAYYKDGNKTPLTAQKELLSSFSDTYNLYLLLLDLPEELTRYAAQKIDQQKEKAAAMHEDYRPSYNFVNNRLVKQLFSNDMLHSRLADSKLSWEAAYNQIDLIYRLLTQTEAFKAYQELKEPSYEDDKRILRHLYSEVLPNTEELDNALEEIELKVGNQSMFLEADTYTILSFVIKTIKRFKEDSNHAQPILEMFDEEKELDFSKQLLKKTIENSDKYSEMINQKLRNWDPDRIAYMDRIIMLTALAEIYAFPDIAIEVTMNEYIEIAKEYSTDSSSAFINGILDQIVQEQKRLGKLWK